MPGHSLLFRVVIFALLVLAIDFYLWLRLKPLQPKNALFKYFRKSIFPISISFGLFLLAYAWIAGLPGLDPVAYRRYFIFTGVFQLIWMPRLLFVIVDVILLIPRLLVKRQPRVQTVFSTLGLVAWGLGTLMILHAILAGKTAFRTREIVIVSEQLPAGFHGLRIAQFSDAHLGSFGRERHVRKGLALMQSLQPDLIVFTGDLINTAAEEAWPYLGDFKALHAPLGKYAILGNHDIGDYVKGDTIRPPDINRALLRAFYEETGFILLEDSTGLLTEQGDSLVIAGVDNWGLPPFQQRGDLRHALGHFPGLPTLLLTHDPSHWVAEVQQHPQVFLTLSGHTHGMQFGLYTRSRKWSPVQYKYKHWVGHYQHEQQHLYVSPGFGFIGLPSRLGIYPEISLIRLESTR